MGAMVLACVACGTSHGSPGEPPQEAPSNGPSSSTSSGAGATKLAHRYQTTASVGDFLQVTLDKASATVSYTNKTNGLTASGVPYVQDDKGVYSFPADPNGHLKQAIEVEDYALIVDVDKAGPNKDTRALAIGAASQPLAPSDLDGRRFNMMQFRTRNGGMEVGNVVLSYRGGNFGVNLQSYWPRGAMLTNDVPFHVGRDGGEAREDLPEERRAVHRADGVDDEHRRSARACRGLAVVGHELLVCVDDDVKRSGEHRGQNRGEDVGFVGREEELGGGDSARRRVGAEALGEDAHRVGDLRRLHDRGGLDQDERRGVERARGLDRDYRTEAVADEERSRRADGSRERDDVVGVRSDVVARVLRRAAPAVAAEVGHKDAARLRQVRRQRSDRLGVARPAAEHDRRRARSRVLVVELEVGTRECRHW